MTNYDLHAIAKSTQLIFLFNNLIFIFMEKKREKEAIDLFIASVGKEPKACGYNAIDIYEKQRAYIYAKDEKTLKAFKSSQNIIRWIILWGFWPIFLCLCIIFFYGIPRVETIEDLQKPLIMASIVFFVAWIILLLSLCLRAYILGKQAKSAYWINY